MESTGSAGITVLLSKGLFFYAEKSMRSFMVSHKCFPFLFLIFLSLLTKYRHSNLKCKLARDISIVKSRSAVFSVVALLSSSSLTWIICPEFAYDKVMFKSVKSLNIVKIYLSSWFSLPQYANCYVKERN